MSKNNTNSTILEDNFYKGFPHFLPIIKQYEEVDPKWFFLTANFLFWTAVSYLRDCIEDPKNHELNWDNPCIQLDFPLKLKTEESATLFEQYSGSKHQSFNLIDMFSYTNSMNIFYYLFGDTVILCDGDNKYVIKDEQCDDFIRAFYANREGNIDSLIDVLNSSLTTFSHSISDSFSNTQTRNKTAFTATVNASFWPLIYERDSSSAHYSILANLTFKGLPPTRWSHRDRQFFWKNLLQQIIDIAHRNGYTDGYTLSEHIILPEPTIKPGNAYGIHKQPRDFMKRTGALVARDTNFQSDLFLDNHSYDDAPGLKDTLSRSIAITGNHLIKLWQRGDKNDQDFVTINNLADVARDLRLNQHRLKLFFVHLGGYPYPRFISKDKEKGRNVVTFTQDTFFKIEIDYYATKEEIPDLTGPRWGTRYLNFIADKAVKAIRFKPNQVAIDALQGDGLGYVPVSDQFVAFSLELSDMAYKLLSFTGSNTPSARYYFSKLITQKFLHLEKQVKKQGKPRVLKSIKAGFEELKNKGHIKNWSYRENTDIFSWEYTDKIVKHSELK